MPWGDANDEDDTGRGTTRTTLDDGDVANDEDDARRHTMTRMTQMTKMTQTTKTTEGKK
jgi:hypothetical protein